MPYDAQGVKGFDDLQTSGGDNANFSTVIDASIFIGRHNNELYCTWQRCAVL
jgi:hypothetical protein